MKSPRFELTLFAALLISAMVGFVWMQYSSVKAKATKPAAAVQSDPNQKAAALLAPPKP